MSVPPGWYRDPAEPTVQRWWDGDGWVGDPLPADATPPPGPPAPAPLVPALVPAPPQEPIPPESPTPPASPVPPGWSPGRQLVPDAPPPRPQGYPLATLGSRLVARLVDIGIVLALNVAVNGWFVYHFWLEVSPVFREAWRRSLAGESMSDLPETGDAGNLPLVILVLAAALWFAYEVPAIANTGQTPGKRLLRIRVVRLEANGQLGFGRSFRRWNTMGLPTLLWLCFGLGFLLQLADVLFAVFDRPLQQALHDKSALTAVVSVAAGPGKESLDEPADSS